jgi:hypothetical protein
MMSKTLYVFVWMHQSVAEMVVDRDLPLIVPKPADEVGGNRSQASRTLRHY